MGFSNITEHSICGAYVKHAYCEQSRYGKSNVEKMRNRGEKEQAVAQPIYQDLSDMRGRKVLIVDDDVDLCQIVKFAFGRAGAQVFSAQDGREGVSLFRRVQPDLVLLDIRMPDVSGWEVCRTIRKTSNVPVILLTTLSRDQEIVQGLDSGADDFITKPFSLEVMMARARAVLRRTTEVQGVKGNRANWTYNDGSLSIDLTRQRVVVHGQTVQLTATEFKLLAYLLQNTGHALTYESILNEVWGAEYQDSIGYVHVYLSHLRRKIEDDPRRPRYLLTEYGVGYRFEPQHVY